MPEASAFTVTVNGAIVALAASNAVTITGAVVTLTLATPVEHGDTVIVTYTPPTGADVHPRSGSGQERHRRVYRDRDKHNPGLRNR